MNQEGLWRSLLAEVIPKVYAMFIRKGTNPSLAEELTQKTVFDAVKGRETFDPEKGEMAPWIMTIAKNNLAMEMRKRAKAPKNMTIEQALAAVDDAPLPDELLEKQETADLVNRGLDEINENERDVLKAKYVDDLSARQIAGKLKITEKAVHSLLYRARISLRDKLRRLAPQTEGQS